MTNKELEIEVKKVARKLLGQNYDAIAEKIQIFRNANLSVSAASRDKDYGDYSTNILFLIAKIKKNTLEEAFDFVKSHFDKIRMIKKIEFANGYLNFFLDEKVFISDFENALKDSIPAFIRASNQRLSASKVIFDYVSANPTGPLTLGNARGAVIGNCLAKIFKLCGAQVVSEYYVNDRGFQIETLGKSALALSRKITINNEENFYRGEYLEKISQQHKEKILELLEPIKIGKFIADVIMNDLIKPSLKNFEIEFDNYFLETILYQTNLNAKVLNFFKKKKFISERDGAIWLLLTKIGEKKDEVIIKSSGEYTYFWSDILYHYNKFFIRKSQALLIVSADHLDHTRRLRIVFEKIFKVKSDNFKFIVYQMVHLVRGDELVRMAKRKGVYVTLDDLVKEVGLDPVKFFFLKYATETTVEFNLELAKKNSEENPVWYLHYAYVRLKKILDKATVNSLILEHRLSSRSSDEPQPLVSAVSPSQSSGPSRNRLRQVPSDQLLTLLNNPNYKILFRKIHQFPDLISDIATDLRPNLLPQYLSELAKLIHNFYEKEPILRGLTQTDTRINTDKKIEITAKLLFIDYLMKILETGFYLLGIEPKKEL